MKAAVGIRTAINKHVGQQIEISKEKSIALSKKPAYKGKDAPEILDVEGTSRSIQVDGFKGQRSVVDFVNDIFQGGQSKDGNVNVDGVTVPVTDIVDRFTKFARHMKNKVEAVNTSSQQADAKGNGPTIQFESLSLSGDMVPAGGAGGAKGVFVHRDSPRSIEVVNEIHNDAVVIAEVYNTMVDAFPALFPEGKVDIPVLDISTPKVETKTEEDTTAVEETVLPEAETVDEQQTQVETVTEEVQDGVLNEEETTQTEEVDAELQKDEPGTPVEEPTEVEPVTEKFADTFIERDTEIGYENGEDLIELLSGVEGSDGYVEFAKAIMSTMIEGANERLKTSFFNKKDGPTIFDKITNGEDITNIRDYKLAMLVDPETGQYDPNLLSIAAVAVVDWLSSVRSADPSQLSETLDDLGVTISDLAKDDMNNIMYGVSPRQSTEVMAKTIMRMWNVDIDPDSQLVDARGAVEGLVKELVTVLANEFEFIEINNIPVIKNGEPATTPTFNVRNMQPIQKEIGLLGQNSIQKLLTPELGENPSFGNLIPTTDQSQSRGNVKLSNLEKTALKNMQDTPHLKAKGISDLSSFLGFDFISNMLGHRDVSSFSEGHPLRNSIEGKNLSIKRDWEDAQIVLDQLQGDNNTPVYYPVGISKVGRHQFKGINPQNNKILRALVTPTHSTLDMTNQSDIDAFWLTVAQSADLGEGFKVENNKHSEILANVRDEFNGQFGDATRLVEQYLETGNLDKAALTEATDQITMAQLNTIFAVADLNTQHRKSDNLTSFETSLSFELDGKTDGPANMMSNFGQGTITQDDFTNFQRVGFFLGSKSETLNKFFSQDKNVDLYNETSARSQDRMFTEIAMADPSAKHMMYAAQRFAGVFGDFKINKDGSIEMTRNTAKNPMTKSVYGSGVKGVGEGIAQEMVLGFYEAMTQDTIDPLVQHYINTDLKADFEMLFNTDFPTSINWKDAMIGEGDVKFFERFISGFFGQILSDVSKEVIGDKITHVNDTLVFATGVQTEFLKALFEKKLAELAELRASEGKIKRNALGKGVIRQLSKRDYDGLVKELRAYAPLYSNGAQTLAVGSFSGQVGDVELSSNLDGKLQMKSTMEAPDIAGVKVIPYLSIGRGDAMMMNNVYGALNAPKDTLPVFDGIDMPVNRVKEYAETINQAVMKNWDADVLGDIVTDFTKFINSVETVDQDLLMQAYRKVSKASSKSTVIATTPFELLQTLEEARRQNQARKQVLRDVPLSLDHMGGSDTAYTRGPDGTVALNSINEQIRVKLSNLERSTDRVEESSELSDLIDDDVNAAPDVIVEDPKVIETSSDVLIEALLKESNNKPIRDTIKVLKRIMSDDIKVIIGGEVVHEDAAGYYDPDTKTIHLEDNNQETMVHEMIHAATFDAVLDHYDGKHNEAVDRLETLMEEFLNIDFGKSSKEVRQSATAAASQILGYQTSDSVLSKASALNEFMAWSLSNDNLIQDLKKRDSKLARFNKTVRRLMQRILKRIPTDMYSNILFNTLIINGETGMGGDNNNGNNNNNDNSDGEMTPPAHNFTNFWIDIVRKRLAEYGADTSGETISERNQFIRYKTVAEKAAAALDFGGFAQSPYQKKTFIAIHMVLATEMRLDSQSSKALNDMFEYITNNLTPEMFGPKNADQRYSAVRDLLGNTKNDEGVSDAIAVILALSQTSNGFRNALDQLPPPQAEGIDVATLNDFLTSVTGMLMNKAVGSIDTADQSVKETMDLLADNILRQDSNSEFTILSDLMNSINKADAFVSQKIFSKLAERASEIDIAVKASDRSSLTKVVVGSIAFAAKFLEEDRSKIAAQGIKDVTHMGQSLDRFIPVREFVSEIVGSDKTNAEVVLMLDRTNKAVQAVRQELREDMPVIFQDAFETHPDAAQWKSMHQVLGKAGFATLFSLANPDNAFNVLKDKALLSRKIAARERVINKNFSQDVADTIIEKSQQLAGFMVGNGAGHQLWKNAYAINKLAGNYNKAMDEQIDILISLYALEQSSQADKDAITEMYENDPEAVKNLVVYMKALDKEEDLKIVSETAKMNGYKGYIPDHAKSGAQIIVDRDSNRDTLTQMGWVRVGDYTAEKDISSISRGYYTTTVKQGGQYSQGVLQSVQDSYRGVDATTGLTVTGNVSGVISGDGVFVITKALNHPNSPFNTVTKEVLIPVFDDSGVIMYERAINPDLIEQYTQPKSNLALMLGSWAGRQAEEKFAHVYNNELIVELKKIYDEREKGEDNLFVDMSDKNLKDEVFKDSWRVISPQTKQQIEEVFGEKGGFMVRKDMVNLSLGYRDPSVVDMWTGKTRVPKGMQTAFKAATGSVMGDKAVSWLTGIEGGVQSVISLAKDSIVVRSLIVPFLNSQANVVQLANRGVGLKQITSGYPDKLVEVEQYNNNAKKRNLLKTQMLLSGNNSNRVAILQHQIQVIDDQNARMTIAPLIEAGAYKNISEGITDLDVQLVDGKLGEWVENQLNRLPGGVQTIAKYGILAKDTAIYKGANKAVQYGDFIAKAIYYDHLVNQGLDANEAMKKINEEFVNFSVLPGRTRTYLEGLGATWFLSFKIRIMKISMGILRDNPVRALLISSALPDVGSPVGDNLATVVAEGRLDYALGWDMLFGSPELNPWMNMSNWD